MRTTGFSKVMIAIVFAMASVLTMNAAGPGKVTNVEMDNGRISAKVVYQQKGNYLTPDFSIVFITIEQPKLIRNIRV